MIRFLLGANGSALPTNKKGMLPEAIIEYQAAIDRSNRVQLAVGSLAHAYARRDQVTTSFHRISSRPFISSSGEKRRAIELLEQAYSEHSVDIVKAKIDSKLNGLRSEPRFETLIQKVGFPQ